jgi:hypothetical protein
MEPLKEMTTAFIRSELLKILKERASKLPINAYAQA